MASKFDLEILFSSNLGHFLEKFPFFLWYFPFFAQKISQFFYIQGGGRAETQNFSFLGFEGGKSTVYAPDWPIFDEIEIKGVQF